MISIMRFDDNYCRTGSAKIISNNYIDSNKDIDQENDKTTTTALVKTITTTVLLLQLLLSIIVDLMYVWL